MSFPLVCTEDKSSVGFKTFLHRASHIKTLPDCCLKLGKQTNKQNLEITSLFVSRTHKLWDTCTTENQTVKNSNNRSVWSVSLMWEEL